MSEDEVVREERAAREAFAALHGFDIRKMVAALHELGAASGRELVELAPRPVVVAAPPQTESPNTAAPMVEHSQLVIDATIGKCS